MLFATVDIICVQDESIIETLRKFKPLLSNGSERAADIVNILLRSKLSQDVGEGCIEVPLQSLLDWQLWPVFIELYGGKSWNQFLYYILTYSLAKYVVHSNEFCVLCIASAPQQSQSYQEWKAVMVNALIQLQELCDSIFSAKITVQQLDALSKHADQLYRLCESSSKPSKPTQEGFPSPPLQKAVVKREIQRRQNEMEHFQQYRQQALSFVKFLQNSDVEGIENF